ncbi:hypothetical protein F4780DRAFT_360163 [Xylariomycetidae sp. FL0641]|nr:hypothetical protein F4780DRAFT_360163 [Xylariomycetidae sp. FL0641]
MLSRLPPSLVCVCVCVFVVGYRTTSNLLARFSLFSLVITRGSHRDRRSGGGSTARTASGLAWGEHRNRGSSLRPAAVSRLTAFPFLFFFSFFFSSQRPPRNGAWPGHCRWNRRHIRTNWSFVLSLSLSFSHCLGAIPLPSVAVSWAIRLADADRIENSSCEI